MESPIEGVKVVVGYRESDFALKEVPLRDAFLSHRLAEEGLGWCVEEDEAAPAGHRLRIIADSLSFPEDGISRK